MLKQADKSALLSSLNSGTYSQKTLHSLLYAAWSKGEPGIVRLICETKSYTLKVLANIVVEALENEQDAFAQELLNGDSKLADAALHAAVGRGNDLSGPLLVIMELIHLGANVTSRDAETGQTILETANNPGSPSSRPVPEIIDHLTKLTDHLRETNETASKKANQSTVITANLSQAERSKAFQDLAGKEAVMPHIKKANFKDQTRAMESVTQSNKTKVTVLDIGGGDGLTAPVLKAIRDKKESVSVLNVEPETKYEEQYRSEHEAAGISVSGVIAKPAQKLTAEEVKNVFPAGADIVFASHSMYFEMDDIWLASNAVPDTDDPLLSGQWVEAHPLTKYLDVMAQDGVFVVTLGSAQELGATRTMALGNHNLSINSDPFAQKEPGKILGCFKNMQLFAKHFECLKPHYETHRNCTLDYDTFASVARVPLGKYNIVLNSDTGVYEVHNPFPQPIEQFHAPEVFRFYASWPTPEEVQQMNPEDCRATFERQTVFLNLLPVFTVGRDLALRDETMAIRKV